MVYLLDANVLINAARDYYRLPAVPQFWAWLWHHCEQGNIKLPSEIYDELLDGKKDDDPLLDWLKQDRARDVLVLGEEVERANVQTVIERGYADDLTDDEVDALGRDPMLVAYALAQSRARTVVTAEISRPSKIRSNRKIPDVCDNLQVLWVGPFELNSRLDFRTDWDS